MLRKNTLVRKHSGRDRRAAARLRRRGSLLKEVVMPAVCSHLLTDLSAGRTYRTCPKGRLGPVEIDFIDDGTRSFPRVTRQFH